MSNTTAAQGATTDIALDAKKDEARQSNSQKRSDLLGQIATLREQEISTDGELRQMNMDLFKNPHYTLKEPIGKIILEVLALIMVAGMEISLNERGLECFAFSTTVTWIMAGVVGIVLGFMAFGAGIFCKRSYKTGKASYGFLGLLLIGMGLGILYAICMFRAYYFLQMAGAEDAPQQGEELSVGIQMLISGSIFLGGVIVTGFCHKAAKDEELFSSFNAKKKEMRKIKKDLKAKNDEVAGQADALKKELKKIEAEHKGELKPKTSLFGKTENKQKEEPKKPEVVVPPAKKSAAEIDFENKSKVLQTKVDAGISTGLEHEFTNLEVAAANYPAGLPVYALLMAKYQENKNHSTKNN